MNDFQNSAPVETVTDEDRKTAAALHALGAKNCPDITPARLQLVAQFLSVVDGVVVVTGGEVIGGGRWHVKPSDGTPRMTSDNLGSGVPIPYPITRLIDDLLLVYPEFYWSGCGAPLPV